MCAYSLPYSISIIYTLYTTTIHYIGNLAIIIFMSVQARIGGYKFYPIRLFRTLPSVAAPYGWVKELVKKLV